MSLFTEELRKCLNAAGLSDCGENDAWNYWYQRVLKAHNEAVERQIATELAENDKLRELMRDMWHELDAATQYDAGGGRGIVTEFADHMRELGVEL